MDKHRLLCYCWCCTTLKGCAAIGAAFMTCDPTLAGCHDRYHCPEISQSWLISWCSSPEGECQYAALVFNFLSGLSCLLGTSPSYVDMSHNLLGLPSDFQVGTIGWVAVAECIICRTTQKMPKNCNGPLFFVLWGCFLGLVLLWPRRALRKPCGPHHGPTCRT